MQGFMQSTRSVTEHTWEGLNMHVMCQGSGGLVCYRGRCLYLSMWDQNAQEGCVCVCVCARACVVSECMAREAMYLTA